jgi:molybdopterin synthase catalytic subunit
MRLETGTHVKGTLELSDIIHSAKSKSNFNKAGAIATFIGIVRGKSANNCKVEKLAIEAYEEKADDVLFEICTDLEKRKGILDVQIHHLVGEFRPGEDLVYVLVVGEHRKEVFSVLKEAVERYKKEVPIFKKEFISDKNGKAKSYWIKEMEISR